MEVKMASVTEELEELSTSSYSCHLLDKFRQFWEEELFCDLDIHVDDQQFKVHKAVMAGCSDYFRAMFSHGMRDSNSNSINLQTISSSGLKPLLDYAYTGKLLINMTRLQDILPVAAFLQITSALELITGYLKSKMTFSNAHKIVELGSNYGISSLGDFHRRLILDRFLEFTETEEFLHLDADALTDYLQQDTLNTTTEAQLLKHVLKWYEFDRPKRDPVIHIVLERIRYVQDGWPAIEYARVHDPFTTNKKCQNILKQCTKYMTAAHRKHLNQNYRTRVRYDKHTLIQMGGIKSFASEVLMGFVLGDDDDIDSEPHGTGRNNYYHKNLGQWLPLGVNGVGDCRSHNPMVAVNDFGIMVGGYLYSYEGEETFQHCSNEVKLFDPVGFSLWDLNYLLAPRAHHAVAYAPGYIYAIGGKNESGPLRSVERYHLDTDTWSHITPLEMGLLDHAAASDQDTIYISGGLVNGVIVNTVWAFDPREDEWIIKPALLTPRAGHTMSHLENMLVVCGGRTGHDSSRCLSSVEAYDLELDQWSFLTPMRIDCADMTSVVEDGKLLILGGQNSVGELQDKVQEYCPKTKKWGTYCKLPEPMKNIGCCSVLIKLTPSGEEDTDSVAEEYERRFEESEDEGHYFGPSDDESNGGEFMELREPNSKMHHWPC